jgi:hypothetical protein
VLALVKLGNVLVTIIKRTVVHTTVSTMNITFTLIVFARSALAKPLTLFGGLAALVTVSKFVRTKVDQCMGFIVLKIV